MIETSFDENWRLDMETKIAYLISSFGKIFLNSERTGFVQVIITIASCLSPKNIEIQCNEDLVFSGFVQPNQFNKIIFQTLLPKGPNTLSISSLNTKKIIVADEKKSEIHDEIGIKDFLIIFELRKRII